MSLEIESLSFKFNYCCSLKNRKKKRWQSYLERIQEFELYLFLGRGYWWSHCISVMKQANLEIYNLSHSHFILIKPDGFCCAPSPLTSHEPFSDQPSTSYWMVITFSALSKCFLQTFPQVLIIFSHVLKLFCDMSYTSNHFVSYEFNGWVVHYPYDCSLDLKYPF